MFLIDHITPDKATGATAEAYAVFSKLPEPPHSVQLYSVSEEYLSRLMSLMQYHAAQEDFSFPLLAALRYVGAVRGCFDYCTTYNRQLLASMGMTDEELDALGTDSAKAMDPKEAALVDFVGKALATPDAVSRGDIDAVLAQGWTERQMFESLAYASQLGIVGTLFNTFRKK
jgi:alkylhydroperoxidase family enzyme